MSATEKLIRACDNASLADVMEFESWPDDKKKVARAAVAFAIEVEEAQQEAWDDGYSNGKAVGMEDGRQRGRAEMEGTLYEARHAFNMVWAKLKAVLPAFGEGDHRRNQIAEVVTLLHETIEAHTLKPKEG